METYRVTGTRRVAGVDPGGTVELDPERVNIPALVSGGHVEPVRGTEAADSPDGAQRLADAWNTPEPVVAKDKARRTKAEPGSDVT